MLSNTQYLQILNNYNKKLENYKKELNNYNQGLKYKSQKLNDTNSDNPCNNTILVNQNPNLRSACACQRAADSLYELIEKYNTLLDNYNNILKPEYDNYLNNLQNWTNLTGKYRLYANMSDDPELVNLSKQPLYQKRNQLIQPMWSRCALAWEKGTALCKELENVLLYTNDIKSCWINPDAIIPLVGEKVKCVRTLDQVIIKLKQSNEYLELRPKELSRPEYPPPPSNNTIQCCSQSFSNIQGNNIDINNIRQNCNLNIRQQIDSAISKPDTPDTKTDTPDTKTDTPDTKTDTNTNTIEPFIIRYKIPIILSLCIILLILLFIFIYFYFL